MCIVVIEDNTNVKGANNSAYFLKEGNCIDNTAKAIRGEHPIGWGSRRSIATTKEIVRNNLIFCITLIKEPGTL